MVYDDYIGGQPSATARTVPPAQEPQVRQPSTASTTIADTAPIPTNSSSHATNIPITSQDVDELNPHAIVDGNTFVNPFAISSTSAAAASSSQNVDPSNMHTFYQPYSHEFQWTKDHPLEQVIGEPSRPVFSLKGLILKFIALIEIGAIGPPRPFKVGWHNSSIVRRSGTGKSPPLGGGTSSPFPLAANSKSFKRVGSTRGLPQI
nr:hypothetical protein [Tanacetum cinerariifolium]